MISQARAAASRPARGERVQAFLRLMGDSLVEPFGPEGLGISKSFPKVFDNAWMAARFKKGSGDLWSYNL